MVDVERLCSRVLVIDKGRLVYDGPLDPLRRQFGPDRDLVLDLAAPPGELEISGATEVDVSGARVRVRFDSRRQSAMEILTEVAAGREVVDFAVRELPVDEVIARLYREGFGSEQEETGLAGGGDQ
jgi:ABC-2 type transport system ATP-binding protein